jgi:RNA polymerase subunit RPABC4/transcription elongation factor Spt4
MADPLSDPVIIAVVLAGVALAIVVAYFEMKFIHKKMKNRRVRSAKQDSSLPDEAHNAVVTAKAIAATLERQGVQSREVTSWIQEAEMAYQRGNYRVTKDLIGKAKERLLALKSAQASKGDIVKLEQLATVGGSEEVTTKEILTKEVPPNFPQSKFSIEVAGRAIEQARSSGRDIAQATELLEAAKGRFEAKDYDGALTMARLSTRSAEGKKVEMPAMPSKRGPTTAIGSDRACPSCGAALRSDDMFCRKCGTRLVPSVCASCGASLLGDDSFCPKCGKPVSQ